MSSLKAYSLGVILVLFAHSLIGQDSALQNQQSILMTKMARLIAEHGSLDYITGKIHYNASQSKTEPNVLIISEIYDRAVINIEVDLSKIKLGDNVLFKKYKKDKFSIVFKKSICKDSKTGKAKKIELFFEESEKKRTIDYVVLYETLEQYILDIVKLSNTAIQNNWTTIVKTIYFWKMSVSAPRKGFLAKLSIGLKTAIAPPFEGNSDDVPITAIAQNIEID